MTKKHDDDNHGHPIERHPELPYVKDSETSKDAAISKEETYKHDELRVMAHLKSAGDVGATDYEIEVGTGLRQSSASARRNGLVQKGFVRDSGLKRKTRTGRYATVWILGTGHAVRGSGNERVPRPSPAHIKSALAQLNRILEHSELHHGPKPEADLHALLRWLSKLARQQDALALGIVANEPKEEEPKP